MPQAEFHSFFSGVILDARLKRGESQKAFASFVGVSQPLIAAWEKGDRPILESTLVRIASALDLSLVEFLYPPLHVAHVAHLEREAAREAHRRRRRKGSADAPARS